MNKTIAAAASAAVLAAALVGCHGSSSSHPAASLAVRSGEAQARTYLFNCIPSSGVGQVNLGRKLLTKDGRKAFGKCLAIPQDQRTVFEGAVLTAAEHVKWSDKTQRTTFFTVTAPALAEHYRNAK